MEQLFSTAVFQAPMINDVSLLAANQANVYVFEFAYKGSMTICDVFRLSPMKIFMNYFGRHVGASFYQRNLGVCHGDDMFYLFPFKFFGFPKTLKTRSDKLTSQRFLDFINNFCATGNPGSVDSVQWEAVKSADDFRLMKIDTELSFGPYEQATQRRLNYWNQEINPNVQGSQWSHQEIQHLHNVIAERRSSLLDSQQLFS